MKNKHENQLITNNPDKKIINYYHLIADKILYQILIEINVYMNLDD